MNERLLVGKSGAIKQNVFHRRPLAQPSRLREIRDRESTLRRTHQAQAAASGDRAGHAWAVSRGECENASKSSLCRVPH
jgi:hypothetical protein